MHWRGWRLNPLRRTAIIAAGAIIGGLAMGLASAALAPQQAPPAPAADPLMTPPVILPEWFRLTYFAILRAVPEKLAGLAVMFTAMLAPCVPGGKGGSGRCFASCWPVRGLGAMLESW